MTVEQAFQAVIQSLYDQAVAVELSRPDEQFGDLTTNVALRLSKSVGKPPREVADALVAALQQKLPDEIVSALVAGPGFINLTLSDQTLLEQMLKATDATLHQQYAGQEVLVEFGDPNPLKAMHLGHLYSTIVGDTIASLLEVAGAKAYRLSYHGDVGPHVASAIWGIGETIQWQIDRLTELEAEQVTIDGVTLTAKTVMGFLYAKGATARVENPKAAARIDEINQLVYARSDDTINTIYDWGVHRSFAYFDSLYKDLGVHYNQRYLESQSSPRGVELVRKYTGQVFEESDGAIIYRGEKVGLHTAVFINSRGLPTYQAKDLGLAELKNNDYPNAVKSIIITANEQSDYFKVMLAALAEFDADLAVKTQHIAHGFLTLTTGKMSSRTGEVYGAEELLTAVRAGVEAAYPESPIINEVYLAAVKYSFLKNRIGGDIVFDVETSISLEGNSGPYLQYAHARARSILDKAGSKPEHNEAAELETAERSLARKIGEYPLVVSRSVTELMPHHICTFLYELAQIFNRFYEHNRVIDDPRQHIRLGLVQAYADVLADGLHLLNIPAPEHM
jgi:arginyl-tRNA synthetase